MGRAVYQGVYDPGCAHADEDGFRTDVIGRFGTVAIHGDALARWQLYLIQAQPFSKVEIAEGEATAALPPLSVTAMTFDLDV